MGYRSEVAYVIKFPNKDLLNAFKVSNFFEDKMMREAFAECEVLDEQLLVRFSADSVKWYESYPEVDSHHKLITMACNEFSAGAQFVRIGEDYDDVQVNSEGDEMLDAWDHLRIIRTVEFN